MYKLSNVLCILGPTCNADDLVNALVKIFEDLIINPSAFIFGKAHHKLLACCHALQNLFACSKIAQQSALEGKNQGGIML